MKRDPLRVFAVAMVLAVAATSTPSSAQTALENKLKAAIVSKFPQFVEWPQGVVAGRVTVDLCVAAPDSFSADLQQLVGGESLSGRPVAVRRIQREQDLDGCQLVYFPAGAARRTFLQKAASLPVLTVGDDERFLDDGGIVRLRLVDGRMRFDINAAAARQVGLRISSQLLQLALSVRGQS